MRAAAIDIGSNSIRLLVADVAPPFDQAPLETVRRAGEVCRLGQGLSRGGKIDGGMAERAAQITAEFLQRARSLGAVHCEIAATAALRQAENGRQVAEWIGSRIGVPVRILTGEEEARIVYSSVVTGLGRIAERGQCVVFDLGGGSTEVVSGFGVNPGRWVSLHIGAVSLTERFSTSDEADDGPVAEIRAAAKSEIMQHCADMPETTAILAGVGGTVTVLAALDRGLKAYDPALLEGWTIVARRLEGVVDRLLRSSHRERAAWPVMGEGRADIVLAGALVVLELMARFAPAGLTASTQGLRYGLVRRAAARALRAPEPEAVKDGTPEAAGD